MNADRAVCAGIALRTMAPLDVRVGARAISANDERLLLPAELAAIATAVGKRRQEFASGRALLREVVGCEDAIPVAPDRRPILPRGVVASLAHDASVAVAAAATTDVAAAIGIDIEPIVDVERDVVTAILRSDDGTRDPLLALVLKEAAYKAWSALGGRMLDHHEVRLDVAGDTFAATVEPERVSLVGRFAVVRRSWLALVVVDPHGVTHRAGRR